MNRHRAILAALSIAGGALVVLLVLAAGVGHVPTALARTVTVDATDDWLTTLPTPPENNGHVMRNASYEGEFIWTDAAGDERTDFADPEQEDLLEFRLTGDANNLYFLAVMSDVITTTGNGAPMIQIAIDLDRDGSGTLLFGGTATTTVSSQAAWEFLATTRFGSGNVDVQVWSESFGGPNNVGAASISATTDLIEGSIPWSELGLVGAPSTPIRFTVAVFRSDGSDDVQWPGDGNAALDVITTQSGNTLNETGDGVADYYFDVYFELDGDPTSPLQISEVFYDPVGNTLSDELPNEFIELYNPAQYLAYMDGKVLGDQPLAGGEDNEGQFQFPGTPLTGTTFAVQPDEYVVVALDAAPYDDDPVFPDHYWADWEFFQGLGGEFNNADVMDLSLVSASGVVHLTMGNNGDNAVLADGTITATLPPSNTVVDGMNYATWNEPLNGEAPADTSIAELDVTGGSPNATEGNSVQRDYTRVSPDTNNSLVDFEPDDVPTPGFAKGLIDHAIYKKGPTVVQAGEVFTYYLYYQVAGQLAPSAVITDILPADVNFITYTASSLVTLTASTEPTLTWDLGDVLTGTVGKLTVTVQLDIAAPAGVLTQTASIGSQSATAEGITDNDTFVLTTTAQAPDLVITKTVETASTPVHLGDPITYTIVVANSGDGDAAGVHVTDTLPSGVTGSDLDQTVTVTASDKVTFTISAAASSDIAFYGQTVDNTAYFSHTSGSGSDDASFTFIGAPVLAITKTVETASTPVHLGDPVTYTIVVGNSGEDDAVGVHITDTLPAGVVGTDLDETRTVTAGQQVELGIAGTVTDDIAFYGDTILNTAYYDHATGSGSDDASFTVLTPDIQITSPTDGQSIQSPDGVSVTIPITVATGDFVIPDDGHWRLWVDGTMIGQVSAYVTTTNLLLGTHVISAELRSPSDQIIGPVDTVVVTITLPAPDLAIAKTVEVARDPVHLGDVVTYTVRIDNNGLGTATGVVMTDELLSGVSFGGWVDQGSAQLPPPSDTITWGPWDIDGQQGYTFSFTATVTSDISLYGQTVVNTAEYDSVDAGSGSDDASFTILTPDIQITSPTSGAVFTATDGVSVTIPITITTGDFIIPDDGHWHLWVDGTDLGAVYAYNATTTLLVGTHVISAVLNSPSHQAIGPEDAVTVTVNTADFFIYLPLVLRND